MDEEAKVQAELHYFCKWLQEEMDEQKVINDKKLALTEVKEKLEGSGLWS